MATAPSLFGNLLGDDATMQRQLDEQRAAQFAQQTQEQRLAGMGYKAGAGLGRGLAGAFGVDITDPVVRKASQIRQLASQFDTTTPEGLMQFAQAARTLDPNLAVQAAQQAQALKEQTAKASIESNKFTMEQKLRDELSKLPPDATEEDILKIVTKFGSPDKVLTALQTSADKAAGRQQQAVLQRERLDEQARRDRERAQDRQDLAVLVASLKAGQGGKPLSAAEIKDVNKLRASVDTANNTIEQADSFIDMIDSGEMKFGAGENALGILRKAAGKANESDLNKVEFEQFVTASVNNILNLAKGPQTDQDAKRAEKQIIDGLSKNDNNAVKRGLESLKKVWNDAKTTDMGALELYSSERGGKNLAPVSSSKKDDPLGIRK